jgi:hypothetical protein
MTQRYFTMLFSLLFVVLYITLSYYVPAQKLSNFVFLFVLGGFYAGKYSMKYPKE